MNSEPSTARIDHPASRIPHPASSLESDACTLCGLRLDPVHAIADGPQRFCCAGCRNVFRILAADAAVPEREYRRTGLFQACRAAGVIAAGARDLPAPEGPDPALDPLAQDLELRVAGMWCSACAWVIEAVLQRTPGVLRARVHFTADAAVVRYLPHRVRPDAIRAAVAGLGYAAEPVQDADPSERRLRRDLLVRVCLAWMLSANIMMISCGIYGGLFTDLGADALTALSVPVWLMATPVVFYCGRPVLRRGWAGLRGAQPGTESLITIGTLAAYAFSLVRMLQGSAHLYFDTAAMLIATTLLGRFVESGARARVTRGIHDVLRMGGTKARRVANGCERWVPTAEVAPGDHIRVRHDERVPVDGRVRAGGGRVDESVITGESRPIECSVGDCVHAGGRVLAGDLTIEAVHAAGESSLGSIAAVMRDALARKTPTEQTADRAARALAPAILAVSAATLAGSLAGGVVPDEAVLRALAVLVITCPCALGIAAPLAKAAMVAACSRMGIVVRRPEAMERMAAVNTVVFDKTGTLTEGRFAVRRVLLEAGVDACEALQRAAALEQMSPHFLARAIREAAASLPVPPPAAVRIEPLEGRGLRGVVNGVETAVGNRACMLAHGWTLPGRLEREAGSLETAGLTVVFCGWGGRVRAALALGDDLKPGASETIAQLRRRGLDVWLLSGDSVITTRAVARTLGIADALGAVTPGRKAEMVRALAQRGRRVAMVGDGINDAAALLEADVGVSVGAGADLLRDVSGVTLLGARPQKLLDLLEAAAFTQRVARGNIIWAVVYNLLALPLAVAGQVTPVVAAVAMFGSSLAVIGNSLRILKQREGSRPARPAHSASIGKVMEAPNQPMIVTRTDSPRTSRM